MSADDEERLAAVHSYRLLDASRPAVLDDLTRLATGIFGMPISAVTLIDRDRQWFAGKTGLDVDETPLDVSFCKHVVAGKQLLTVEDTRDDPRFRDYANVVTDPGIRLYAGAPLLDQDGYVLGAVCVADERPGTVGDREKDILTQMAGQATAHLTAIRNRQLLADLGDELARAASREDDLVATVSHELRTPVTSIQGYLEMLTEDDKLAPYRQFLEPIRRNGDRLVKMVDHLLAGTRPAGTPLTVDRTPVDLLRVAETAVAACEVTLRHRDVKCLVETAGTPAPVRGDFTRLVQAVEQLVRNAAMFSLPGSPVRVVVTYSRNTPSIRVIDHGYGISAAELPHVKERFFRGRQAREQAVAGVGLGLAIAQGIAAAHGGSLSVKSPGVGHGTTARISLRGER